MNVSNSLFVIAQMSIRKTNEQAVLQPSIAYFVREREKEMNEGLQRVNLKIFLIKEASKNYMALFI